MNSLEHNWGLSDAADKHLAVHDEDVLQDAFMRAYVAQLADTTTFSNAASSGEAAGK